MEITLLTFEVAQKPSQQRLNVVRLWLRQLSVIGYFLERFNHFLIGLIDLKSARWR